MKLHATLRRTLALLLVLIFAMSNIGLAEVAEQLTQYEEVPVIFEEEYDETEAVEPEEDPELAAEPEGDAEDQAPDADVPVEEEAAAPEVSAEAYLLDPDSIFADASVANYGGELSYAWERAGEDGEWTAIDGATEAVYVNTDEDREAYAYRCVVSAGDVAAATNEVRFGTVDFVDDAAAAPIDLGLDMSVAQLNGQPTTVEVKRNDSDEISGKIVIPFAGNESGTQDALKLTATATGSEASGYKYIWVMTGDNEHKVFAEDPTYIVTTPPATASSWQDSGALQLKWVKATNPETFEGETYSADITLTAYAIDSAAEESVTDSDWKPSTEVQIQVLKNLDAKALAKFFTVPAYAAVTDDVTIAETVPLVYGDVTYAAQTDCNDYLTVDANSGKVTFKEGAAAKLEEEGGTATCTIKATVANLSGVEASLSLKLATKPAGLKIDLKADTTQAVLNGSDDTTGVQLTVASTGTAQLTDEQKAAIEWTLSGNTVNDRQQAFVLFNGSSATATGEHVTLKVVKDVAQFVTDPKDITVTATYEGVEPATYKVKYLPTLTEEALKAAGIQGLNETATYIQPTSDAIEIPLSLGDFAKDYNTLVTWSIARKEADGNGAGNVNIFNNDTAFTASGKLKIKTVTESKTDKLTATTTYTITATVGTAKTTADITVKPGANSLELQKFNDAIKDNAYDKATALANQSTLKTYEGAELKLVPVFRIGEDDAIGNGNVAWSVTSIATSGVTSKGDVHTDSVGNLIVDTSIAPAKYEITATPDNSGGTAQTVTVQVLKKMPKLELKADRDYVFYADDNASAVPLTITVDMGIPTTDKAEDYYRDLEWTMEPSYQFTNVAKEDTVGFTDGQAGNDFDTSDKHKKAVNLTTPVTSVNVVAVDSSDAQVTDGTVRVTVTSESYGTSDPLVIKVLAAPEVPSDNSYITLDHETIAQGGGNVTASLTAKALENEVISKYEDEIVFEVAAAGEFKTKLESASGGPKLDDFIKQVEGQKGVFNVPALTLKDSSTADYKNKINSDMQENADPYGVKVTISAVLPSTNSTLASADLLIYPIPDKVTVDNIANTNIDGTTDAGKTAIDSAESSPAADRFLYNKQIVLLKATPSTDASGASDPDASLPDWDIVAKDAKGNPTSVSSVITELARGETDKHVRWLKFGVNGGEGSVEITMRATKDVDPSDEATKTAAFKTIKYTVSSTEIVLDPSTSHKPGCPANNWVIDNTQTNVKGENGYGHIFKCGEASCSAKSLPVAHRFITTSTALDLNADTPASKNLKCEICEYECVHTSGQVPKDHGFTDEITYTPVTTDGVYAHTYTCPVCGQLLQDAHEDGDNVAHPHGLQDDKCDLCGADMAQATLTYPAIQVGATDAVLPTLTIDNATSFIATYRPASGAASYITVDEHTGAVSDAKALPAGTTKVQVVATIQILSGGAVAATLTVNGDVEIVERIKAKDIQIQGPDWVTPDVDPEGDNSKTETVYYKYEAVVGGNNPDLSDFQWKIEDGGEVTSADEKLKLYVEDTANSTPDNPQYTEYTSPGVPKNIKTVYVGVANDATGADGDGDDEITFSLSYKGNRTNTGDIETSQTVKTKEIEFLPQLNPDLLDGALQLDKNNARNIAQGEVSGNVIDLDSRYGEVTFEFVDDPQTMTPAQIPEWVVSGKDASGKPAISAKPASRTNVLEGSTASQTFKVTPVVKGPLDTKAPADALDSVKYPDMVKGTSANAGKITIVPKPAGIKILMPNPDPTTVSEKPWVEATDQIMTKNVDAFAFKAVPVDDKGDPITTNTISILKDCWNFTTYEPNYGKAEYSTTKADILDIAYANATTGAKEESQSTDTGAYIVKLLGKATDPITLTATSGTFSASVKITVKSQITKMTVTPALTELAKGEQEPNPDSGLGLTRDISTIKIDAAIVEPTDYDPSVELTWTAKMIDNPDSITGNSFDSADDVTEKLSGTGASRTLDVSTLFDTSTNKAKLVRVTVTAANVDAANITGNYCDIILYPAVTAPGNLTLTLDTTASPNDGSEDGTRYEFLVGESVNIKDWGYAENYGASVKMAAPVVSEDDATNKPDAGYEGKPVVAIESKTDAQGNVTYSVVAKNPGTAKVEIASYNGIETYLYFQVIAGADKVEFTDAAKTDTTRVIGEAASDPDNKSFNVLKSWIKASSKSTDAFGDEVWSDFRGIDGTKNFKLVAEPDNGTVTITEESGSLTAEWADGTTETDTNGGWTITAKQEGSTTIYAMLGDVKSTNGIPVEVQAAAGEIYFVDGTTGERLSAQKAMKVGDKFTLAAKMDIAKTIDGITWDIPDNNNGTVEFGERKDDSVEVTAKAAGSVTVSVSIPDKNAATGADDTDIVHPASKKAFIELFVPADETSTPSISADVTLAGKKAIGVGETTNAVVLGLKLAAGQSVTWTSAAPGTASVNATTGVVTGVAAGATEIIATVEGTEVGRTPVHVLTPITTWNVSDVKITKGETLEIAPTFGDGYQFAAGDNADANLIDTRGLFTIDYKNETKESKYATLTPTDEGKFKVTGLAKGTVTLVMTPFDNTASKEIKVTVTNGALKSFAVSVANSTLYLAPSGTQEVTVTYNPTSAPANLTWTAYQNGIETDDITVKKSDDTHYIVAAAEGAAQDVEYVVTASAEGVQGIAPQSFNVVVMNTATGTTNGKIVLKKVGTDKTFDVADGATVEVVKGEKLQAMLYDDTDPLGGVTWSTTAKSSKATVSGNVITAKSGKAEITASAGGKTYKFTVSAKSAPSVRLDNPATITVGVGEKFTMGLKETYKYQGEWYTVTGGEALGLVPEQDAAGNKTHEWTASEEGKATITLTPTWGKSAKTVNIEVKPEADLSIYPDTQILTKGDKLRITANMAGGYANLTWTVEGTEVTTKAVQIDGKRLTVKKVANDAIEFTSTTKTTATTLKVKAEAKGCGEGVAAEATVNVVDRATLVIPADAKVEFGKDVIGVKETTQAYVLDDNDQNMASSLTWSTGNKKIATVSAAGVVTGKKAGTTTITAKSKATNAVVAQGTIYVLSEAKIQANIWPKTMAQGETATIELTITGYKDTATVLPADHSVEISTGSLLSATSSSDLITVESLKAKEGEDEPAYVYELKLKAKDDVSKVNNKYPKATVAVNLSWKKNAKKGSIQVVEQPNKTVDEALEVYFPEEIFIAKGKNIALTPSFGDVKNVAANFDWVLSVDDSDAAKQAASEALLTNNLLYVKDGKLYADRKAAGGTALLTGTAQIGDGEPTELTALVTVCDAVKSNKDFNIVAPKMKAGLGEKVQMEVEYLNNRKAGSVAWSSSNSKVAAIDKTTGLLTAKKKGTVTIALKVNGKSKKLKNFKVMDSMPTGIHFAKAEQDIAPGKSGTISVVLEGVDFEPAKAGTKELAYTIEVTEGETYLDEAGTDLYAGKIQIASTAPQAGRVVLRATSYNGLVAECVISLSETSISDTPYSEPATIVIRANNTNLTNGETVTMKENESINLTAIVKDENGVEVKNATVTWASDAHYTIETTGSTTAKLTAVKYTEDDVSAGQPVTVTAGNATANFKLKITPEFSKLHVKFVPDANTLIAGQKVKAEFKVDGPMQKEFTTNWNPVFNVNISGSSSYYDTSTTEGTAAKDADKVNDYIGLATATSGYEITAKNKPGTAVIKIRLEKKSSAGPTLADDEKIELDPVTIQIIELPAEGDNSGLAKPADMTVAAGETKTFTAKLAGDYAGKEASDTFKTATTIEVEDTEEPGTYKTAGGSDLTVTGSSVATKLGEFTVTAAANCTPGRYRVTIEAIKKEDGTFACKQNFIVTVTAAPTLEITVPEPLKVSGTNIYATQADKSIALTANVDGTDNGVTWTIMDPGDDADKPTLTPADGKSKTVTLNNTNPATHASVQVTAEIDGIADSDKTITITYAAAPTDAVKGLTATNAVITAGDSRTTNGKVAESDPENIAQIAVGEQVSATLTFQDATTTYANDITWSVKESTTQPALKLDYAEDCRTCKITGVNPTGALGAGGSMSTIHVEAKSGDVLLATFAFQVVKSTEHLDLVYENGSAFDRKLTTTGGTLKAKIDDNSDALVKIRVTDSNGKDITGTVVGSVTKKNNWPISRLSAGKVTITIWVQEGNSVRLSQSYIATVSGS